MTRLAHIGVLGLCLAVASTLVLPPFLPAATPPAATAQKADELMGAITKLDIQVSNLMPTATLLADKAFRDGDGQKVLPLLKEEATLLAALEKAISTDPRLKDIDELQDQVHDAVFQTKGFIAALGDKETELALETQSTQKNPDAVAAAGALALSRWLQASKDAALQQKVIDAFTPVAAANKESTAALAALVRLINLGTANNDIEKKIIEVIRQNLRGPTATAVLAQLDGAQEQKALVGKPFALDGRTSTGGTFSVSSYKGKVVLLDFWATWCGPCIAELPNIKKIYTTYHDKGFEIVGLSCDANDAVLNTFTKEKEMPWVQLRETSQNEANNWHPLAKKYRVEGIPQMFLIDRNGILRHIDAREDLEKKVAALVAEAAK